MRYTDEQLQDFIDFILSPHITTDLPFGEKKMKLSTGEIVIAPNTIRNMIPQRIVDQYSSYCAEMNFKPLGQSVCFEILKACAASTRRCLSGLDTFSANGSSAFENLSELCDALATYGNTAFFPVAQSFDQNYRCACSRSCPFEISFTSVT